MNRLTDILESHLPARDDNAGAAVCVLRNGEELFSCCRGGNGRGERWTEETLTPIYSATKAASAACLLLALYECCQTPDTEVGSLWPRFPLPHATVAELLSHQCGLAALAVPAPIDDTEACRTAIECSTPAWLPPRHGYHPHTFGPMVNVLMLELTGQTVSDFWENRIRRPLGLDFYIGHVPESAYGRVASLEFARLSAPLQTNDFLREYMLQGSAVYRAFHSITGPDSPHAMSKPTAWQIGCPAKGGVASARGLALFYQALLGLLPGSPFPREVRDWMSTPQCSGTDLTLKEPTTFTCGAMCEPAALFGNGGFGHAGAGGSHAFCEPRTGVSFAYVMNRMEPGVLPGERVRALIRALPSVLQA